MNKKDDDSDDGGSGGSGGGGGKGKGKERERRKRTFQNILPEVALTDMDNQFKHFDGLGDKLKGLTDLFSKGFTAAFRAEGLERIKIGLGQIKTTRRNCY